MKKYLFQINALLICAMCVFTSCETDDGSGTGSSDDTVTKCGEVSDNVKDFYADDAVRLAIDVANQGSTTANSILIPPALVEKMSDVLTAVHASEFAARDSVVDVYDVHIFNAYDLRTLVLQVSTDETANPWVKQWIDGNRFTGNADIDGLINTYGLEIDGTTNLGDFLIVNLSSEDALNVVALANNFDGIDGIISASTSDQAGDGDNITVVTQAGENDSYTVTYEVAYDDCENTCQKARFYEFSVSDDCDVSYINTYGDEAPDQDDREE